MSKDIPVDIFFEDLEIIESVLFEIPKKERQERDRLLREREEEKEEPILGLKESEEKEKPAPEVVPGGESMPPDEVKAAIKEKKNLTGANLHNADLRGLSLSGMNLAGSDLSGANFSEANLAGSDLSGTNLFGANLAGSDLKGANLSGANLEDTNFDRAELDGADFSKAKNLSKARNFDLKNLFHKAKSLSGVDLREMYLSHSDLSGIIISGAILRGAKLFMVNLSDAELVQVDLSNARLTEANLTEANLSGANLAGSDLSGTNLFGANLAGSDLSGTNIFGANLAGSDLKGANLSGANLEDTNFDRAELDGADFSRAKNLSKARNLDLKNLFHKAKSLSGVDLSEISKTNQDFRKVIKNLEELVENYGSQIYHVPVELAKAATKAAEEQLAKAATKKGRADYGSQIYHVPVELAKAATKATEEQLAKAATKKVAEEYIIGKAYYGSQKYHATEAELAAKEQEARLARTEKDSKINDMDIEFKSYVRRIYKEGQTFGWHKYLIYIFDTPSDVTDKIESVEYRFPVPQSPNEIVSRGDSSRPFEYEFDFIPENDFDSSQLLEIIVRLKDGTKYEYSHSLGGSEKVYEEYWPLR